MLDLLGLNDIVDRAPPQYDDTVNFRRTVVGVHGGRTNDIPNRLEIWNGINATIYEQNAHGNMSEILKVAGINTEARKYYNTQFGITLNKHRLETITPKRLLAEDVSISQHQSDSANIQPSQLQQIMTAFDIQVGEIDMLLMDTSFIDAESAQTHTVLVAASTAKPISDDLYGTVGACIPASSANGGFSSLATNYVAASAFESKHFPLAVQNFPKFADLIETGETKIIQKPKFGVLRTSVDDGGNVTYENNPAAGQYKLNANYEYVPNAGYVGNDKAVFLVKFGDYKVKVIYYFKVIKDEIRISNIDEVSQKYCHGSTQWLISSIPNGIGADLTASDYV
ncbi:hypothetical protein [Methylobacter sp.]|uniref:hypothetical protein n=1 Tax=Methylobacter sp. TaxID=2051955 RepID=UPI001229BEC4|nr:hypothetical protein [Methylobacter sp.]TAK63576.1 MAG: hypothetical protein EPO18_06195 [Methylobacter sp.]